VEQWLQFAAFVLSLLGFYAALERRLSGIAERVARIEGKLAVIWRRLNAEAERVD
jgi:hypothetical protein